MTSGYMITGYLLTWGAIVAYFWRLSVREQRTRRVLDTERSALN